MPCDHAVTRRRPAHLRLVMGGAPASPEVVDLLAALRHPLRLPILLALEDEPRTAAALARALGAGADEVQYALKQLRAGGLVVAVDRRPTRGTIEAAVYAPAHDGWRDLLAAAEALLARPRRGR